MIWIMYYEYDRIRSFWIWPKMLVCAYENLNYKNLIHYVISSLGILRLTSCSFLNIKNIQLRHGREILCFVPGKKDLLNKEKGVFAQRNFLRTWVNAWGARFCLVNFVVSPFPTLWRPFSVCWMKSESLYVNVYGYLTTAFLQKISFIDNLPIRDKFFLKRKNKWF